MDITPTPGVPSSTDTLRAGVDTRCKAAKEAMDKAAAAFERLKNMRSTRSEADLTEALNEVLNATRVAEDESRSAELLQRAVDQYESVHDLTIANAPNSKSPPVDKALSEELKDLSDHPYLKTRWVAPTGNFHFSPVPIAVFLGRFWYLFSSLLSPWSESQRMAIVPIYLARLLPDFFASKIRKLKVSTWALFRTQVVNIFAKSGFVPSVTESVMYFCGWITPSKVSYQAVVSLLALDLESSGILVEPATLLVVGKRVAYNFQVLEKYDIRLKMDDIAKDLLADPNLDNTNSTCVTTLRSFADTIPYDVGSCMPRKHRFDKPSNDSSSSPAPSNKPYRHKVSIEKPGAKGHNISEINEKGSEKDDDEDPLDDYDFSAPF